MTQQPPGASRIATRYSTILQTVRTSAKTHRKYWLTAFAIAVLSSFAAPSIYDSIPLAQHARARLFQALLEYPRPLVPRFTKLVLIQDDEYWAGYPAGRRPLKRDYLARLVDKLVEADVGVIALDFDMRLPMPILGEKATIPLDYVPETDTLIASIKKAAESGIKLVLPRTLWRADERECENKCAVEPDPFPQYGICTSVNREGQWENPGIKEGYKANITCAYVIIHDDPLRIAARVQLEDGSSMDSLALALARAAKPELVEDVPVVPAIYSSYISAKEFDRHHAIFSASDVLNTRDLSKLKGQAVLVGGSWSTLAYKRGPYIDTHVTPLGKNVGVYVHANFAEAILDGRALPTAFPHAVAVGCEVLFGLGAAIVFALGESFPVQLALGAALSFGLVALEWLALHVFGVFFDAFLPLLALWLHSVFDRVLS